MKKTFLIFTFFISFLGFAQNQNPYFKIDSKIAKIPKDSCQTTSSIANFINSNFKSENDKIRAIFFWTTSNISYDVASINVQNGAIPSEEKIKNALQNKKGVCIDYAEVFNDITTKLGIKSVIIQGYVKQFGVISPVSHAWCGSKIDNKWCFFDPTWGSGYVNNGKYTRKQNDLYFKTKPTTLILSHMPFDYLWQFSKIIKTNQEFACNKIATTNSRIVFDFETEIEKYLNSTPNEQIASSVERIEKNGITNNLIAERIANKKTELQVNRQNNFAENLNKIVEIFNVAIKEYNDFIEFRNRQFKPIPPDESILESINLPLSKLKNCENLLFNIGVVSSENTKTMVDFRKLLFESLEQVQEQKKFVDLYLTKTKIGRKAMFVTTIFSRNR
jgi:Transglutaminase-like superfamily